MNLDSLFAKRHPIVRVIGAVLVCAIGARIIAPGINTDALADFFRSGHASPLLRLYESPQCCCMSDWAESMKPTPWIMWTNRTLTITLPREPKPSNRCWLSRCRCMEVQKLGNRWASSGSEWPRHVQDETPLLAGSHTCPNFPDAFTAAEVQR